MVKVTYTNIQPPIITVDDAIQKKSFIPNPTAKPFVVGNPERKLRFQVPIILK